MRHWKKLSKLDWYWRIDLKSGTNYSWVVSLLPFMEEQALYDRFRLSINIMRKHACSPSRTAGLVIVPVG